MLAKGKTTIFANILTEIYCWRDHWKYERPFVNKEFHMCSLQIIIISKIQLGGSGWGGGGGGGGVGYKCQFSVKILTICQLLVKF